MQPPRHPRASHRLWYVRKWLRIATYVLILATTACEASGSRAATAELPEPLRVRISDGRLSGVSTWSRCSPDTATSRGWCRESARRDDRDLGIQALAASLRAQSDGGDHATQSRWLALVDFNAGPTDSVSLDRARRSLRALVDADSTNAELANDLAAVMLAAADRAPTLSAYLAVVDLASRALVREPSLDAARFNRAIALERLHLRNVARAEWSEVARRERESGWGIEARERATRADVGDSIIAWPSVATKQENALARDSLRQLARRDPLGAREFVLRTLAMWGERASLDSTTAGTALQMARDVAEALASAGGDASLASAVACVDRHRGSAAVKRAVARLAPAVGVYLSAGYDNALRELSQIAATLRAHNCSLWRWAAYYQTGAAFNRGEYDLATRIVDDAAQSVSESESALRGKLLWASGVIELRRGNFERAADRYSAAEPWLRRAGEVESVGAIRYLRTEALAFSGQVAAAGEDALEGLEMLSAYPASGYLADHLANVASLAAEAGLPYAALAIAHEEVAVARRVKRPQAIAWALEGRARRQRAAGATFEALSDLDSALMATDSIAPGAGRDRLRAEISLTRVNLERHESSDAKSQALVAVVREFRRLGMLNQLPAALYAQGQLAVQRDDRPAAIAALSEAVRLVAQRADSLESIDARIEYFAMTDSIYDALIDVSLSQGDTRAAMRYLAAAHAAAWSARIAPRVSSATPIEDRPPPLGRNTAVLVYASMHTRLVTWVGADGRWTVRTMPIARATMAGRVRALNTAILLGKDTTATEQHWLFDALIRPHAERIAGKERLIVVPDREIAQVPFAALRDSMTGRFLVEERELRLLPGVGFLFARRSPPASVAPNVLIFAGADVSGLPRLAHAQREAVDIARLRGVSVRRPSEFASTVLRTPRVRVRRDIVHVAAHAVTDLEQPQRSYLALDDDVLIRARTLAAADLRGVELVVLAACRTQGAASAVRGGAAGLAASFLRAGTRNVIAAGWDVEDASTRELQVALHQFLLRGLGPAAALRATQRAFARASNPAWREARVWAAFSLYGW